MDSCSLIGLRPHCSLALKLVEVEVEEEVVEVPSYEVEMGEAMAVQRQTGYCNLNAGRIHCILLHIPEMVALNADLVLCDFHMYYWNN